MMGESTIEMTKGLSAEVWRNANKQAGFAEKKGRGRRRYWACMHMFQEEGLLVDRDRGLEGRDRDLSWDVMAAEMARVMGIRTQGQAGQGGADQPPLPEFGGHTVVEPGTEGGAGAGQRRMLMGPEAEVGEDDTTEQSSEEEGGDTSEEEVETGWEAGQTEQDVNAALRQRPSAETE